MSRIGKLPIPVPQGVKVSILEGIVTVEGPKGSMNQAIDSSMVKVEVNDGQVIVDRLSDHRRHRSAQGLYRSLLANMVKGVTEGFERVLEINGVGYKAEMRGSKTLVLHVGYSVPKEMQIPDGITCEVQRNTRIVLRGIDKQKVGQLASDVRGVRPPEPYKGKGIKYDREVIRRKVGKTTA